MEMNKETAALKMWDATARHAHAASQELYAAELAAEAAGLLIFKDELHDLRVRLNTGIQKMEIAK